MDNGFIIFHSFCEMPACDRNTDHYRPTRKKDEGGFAIYYAIFFGLFNIDLAVALYAE
jgi:hypothetical protein